MKYFKAIASIFAFVIASLSAAAAAATPADDNWQKSYQGGRYEFFSDKGDLRLHIACPTVDSSPDAFSGVRLIRLSTNRDIGVFKMTLNGKTFDGPIETASKVGSANFKAFMKEVRVSGATVKYALGTVPFPKKITGGFFPIVNDSFPCQTNW